MKPQVSIVIPTRNEEDNIAHLVRHIKAVAPRPSEILVVDDSTDNTAKIAWNAGARIVYGQGEGLGQAIIDGIHSAHSEVVVVMDADYSHDPNAIPRLIMPITHQGYDFTIGSRYVKGGSTKGWNRASYLKSIVGVKLMKLVTGINDSNSGFFALRKTIVDGIELKPTSWKIMLEVLFKGKWASRLEVPITFGDRAAGQSKNSIRERVIHAKHMMILARYRTRRFWKFVTANGVGTFITFFLTWALTSLAGMYYLAGLGIATGVAVVVNFLLNANWTFKGQRKATDPDYEWHSYFKGLPWQKWWKQKIGQSVRELSPGGNTLDIGCGSSPLGLLAPHEIYTGVDLDKQKIAYMMSKGTQDASYVPASVLELPFGDNRFDTVLFIEAIEHLNNWEEARAAIAEISRVTKKKGTAIIATPNYGSWQGRLQDRLYGIFHRQGYADDHKIAFTPATLRKICAQERLVPVASQIPLGTDMICSFTKV